MGQFHILVLGDSILWGQGLSDDERISSIAARDIEAASGRETRVHMFAHSGAWIWEESGSGPPHPSPDEVRRRGRSADADHIVLPGDAATRHFVGERMQREPYVWAQLYSARDELGQAGVAPDLVLVDGGINHVGAFELVNPTRTTSWLLGRIDSLRGWMFELLGGVHESFPDARIVVTGYYRYLSDLSFSTFTGKSGVAALVNVFAHLPFFPWGDTAAHLVDLSRTFDRAINDWLLREVQRFNRVQGAYLAAFADPDFGREHAYGAPQSLVWELDLEHFLEPTDHAKEERRRALGSLSGFEFEVAYRASAGHPNDRGAARYAQQVMRCARSLGLV